MKAFIGIAVGMVAGTAVGTIVGATAATIVCSTHDEIRKCFVKMTSKL